MKPNLAILTFMAVLIHAVSFAKEPSVPNTGFSACATKVLATYSGYLLSVEAEGNEKGEFFNISSS